MGGACVLLVLVGISGCGDDDEPDTAGAPTTSSNPPAAASSSSTTTTTTDGDGHEARCGGGPRGARVSSRGEGWVLEAEIDGRPVEHQLALEDRTAEPRVLGNHDVDGDGADEVFVEIGRGAAASVVGLVAVTDGCEITTVLGPDSFVAQFPVGASVANQRGLSCRDDRLVELSGETNDGSTYRWTSTTHELDGAALAVADTDEGTYTSPGDDEEIRRLGTLDCGTVTL